MSANRRLIVLGPVPPPAHGVSISTSLVLANEFLQDRFSVEHLDTTDRRSGANINTWDVENVTLGLRAIWALNRRLRGGRGVVYLPLSSGPPAFLRDSLFIHLAAARGWKVATHLRGGEFDVFYRDRSVLFRRWIRLTLARVDSMGVMGVCLKGMFEGLMPPARIAVVPNGTPDPDRDGHEPDPDTILFMSNLRERKGVLEAIEAARLVIKQHPSARFVFVGSWYDESLEQAMRDHARPAGERIAFLPPVAGEEKRKLLLNAGVVLFPPRGTEGHPRVVLEAMAAGTPIITTNRGAITETVVDGETGYVLPDPVPEQLAARVLTLLRDPELRRRMGDAARARYLSEFTEERADRRLAAWLDDVSP
jgi:glycosyltransferase involved in cell wall biosynthesis